MSKKTIAAIIKTMPGYLAVKVKHVAKAKKMTLEEAIIFLARKGINA